MASEKSSAEKRTRNWVFFVYPDSAPTDWRDILDELCIPWIESPLHDKDTDGNGEIKKAHWHVMLVFDSVKAYEQVKEITDRLNSPIPQRVQSARAQVRYFLHLDNPDKYQYDRADLREHCGADVTELLKPTSSSRYQLIREMIGFIRDNGISEFIDFADYAANHRYDDWFPLICDNSAIIIREAVRSNRHKGGGDRA